MIKIWTNVINRGCKLCIRFIKTVEYPPACDYKSLDESMIAIKPLIFFRIR